MTTKIFSFALVLITGCVANPTVATDPDESPDLGQPTAPDGGPNDDLCLIIHDDGARTWDFCEAPPSPACRAHADCTNSPTGPFCIWNEAEQTPLCSYPEQCITVDETGLGHDIPCPPQTNDIGSCRSNDDCTGSPWGPICVVERGDTTGLCQECEQAENGSAAQGCSPDKPACGWGISAMSPDASVTVSEPRSVYWCTGCWANSCDPGLACSHDTDTCLPDQNDNMVPDVEENTHTLHLTYVAIGQQTHPPIQGEPHWDGFEGLSYMVINVVCMNALGEIISGRSFLEDVFPDRGYEYTATMGFSDREFAAVQFPCRATVTGHHVTVPAVTTPYYEGAFQAVVELGQLNSWMDDAPPMRALVDANPDNPAYLVR